MFLAENNNSYVFLRVHTDPLPTTLGNTPIKYMIHNSFILGEKVVRPFMDPTKESGYQVGTLIRLPKLEFENIY